jgi:hypothetical protein
MDHTLQVLPVHTITLDATNLGKTFPEYKPTYQFAKKYITRYHSKLSRVETFGDCIQLRDRRFRGEKIEGWLRVPDALKLYEMAYLNGGSVLELGTYRGLSTYIMARAMQDARSAHSITTIDLYSDYQNIARQHLQRGRIRTQVKMIAGDAAEILRRFVETGDQFPFVFVDHSHAYRDVAAACRFLPDLIALGGFALFHDYNDGRNGVDEGYGVYQAVQDTLVGFKPFGVFGCTGLFRRC